MPKNLNGDGAALNTMFRNVFGSIGISLSTANITERTQVRQAYLVDHLTPYDQGYNLLVAHNNDQITAAGAQAGQTATGMIYQQLQSQASVLAYADLFMLCAIIAFCCAPLALLFTGIKGAPRGGAH